jgi:hypothetical protein
LLFTYSLLLFIYLKKLFILTKHYLKGLFNDPLPDGELLVGSDPSAQIKIHGHKTAAKHAIIIVKFPKVVFLCAHFLKCFVS